MVPVMAPLLSIYHLFWGPGRSASGLTSGLLSKGKSESENGQHAN